MHRFGSLALSVLLVCGRVGVAEGSSVQPRAAEEGPFASSSYEAARARARARGVLLFVDAWAPWCHTCLFFRERVAPAIDVAATKPWAEFVAVDTEEAGSRAFVERHPMTAWPTFFLVDPRTDTVRWMSTKLLAANEVEEVVRAEGERYRAELAQGRPRAGDAVARASVLRARGDVRGAAAILEAELSRGGRGERAGVALEALVATHTAAHDDAACLGALVRYAPLLGEAARASALALGLGCVRAEVPRRSVEAQAVSALAEASARDPKLFADDRSTLYEGVVDVAKALGDDARARTLAEEWLAFLEREAAASRTAAERSVYDAHRVAAALALGVPARALEAVEQTARESPSDGNTQLRMAVLLRELGRSTEALARVDLALAALEGPRRVRAFEVRASVHRREGRWADEADAWIDALVEARALVHGARGDALVERLTGELARARFALLTAEGNDDLPAIVQAGDPVLRLRAVNVPAAVLGSPAFERLVTKMVAVMRKAPGVGLAAPQIGLPWRVFVLEDTAERMAKLSREEQLVRGRVPHPLTVVVNPVVSQGSGAPAVFYEGCLSVVGYTAAVARAPSLSVTGLDGAGKAIALNVSGWPARIVQHEFDHLEGTLYVDRMNARSLANAENAKRFVQGRPTQRVLDGYRADAEPVSGATVAPPSLRGREDRRSVRRP